MCSYLMGQAENFCVSTGLILTASRVVRFMQHSEGKDCGLMLVEVNELASWRFSAAEFDP